MNVELRHLRSFVAVAEELNFTRAAGRLHIAQQALSAQIQQLEARVGAPLFVRTTRKVALTPAGSALLETRVASSPAPTRRSRPRAGPPAARPASSRSGCSRRRRAN